MKNLFVIFAVISLAACSTTSEISVEDSVVVANFVWVKLISRDLEAERKEEERFNQMNQDDGYESVFFSNSCGAAEVRYRDKDKREFTVWMHLGEWCANPFAFRYEDQLLVISAQNELKEYYGVREDTNGRAFVLVENWSRFAPLRRELASPAYDYSLECDDELGPYEKWAEKGLVSIDGRDIYQLKGVYLEDIFNNAAP